MPAKCNTKKFWTAAAVILLAIVAIDVVCMLAKCKCASTPAIEEKQEEVKPKVPTAQERTASKVAARMADKKYMADLKKLENRQQELAVTRTKIIAEYKAWLNEWLAANPEAKAISEKIDAYVASKNGKVEKDDKEYEALEAELKKLIKADPKGAEFLERLDAVAAEEAEHHNLIAAVIGARLRQDMESGAKAESAAAEQWRKEHAPEDDMGRGNPKRKPLKPGYTNEADPFSKAPVAPQGIHAPTNFPGYIAPTNAVIVDQGTLNKEQVSENAESSSTTTP